MVDSRKQIQNKNFLDQDLKNYQKAKRDELRLSNLGFEVAKYSQKTPKARLVDDAIRKNLDSNSNKFRLAPPSRPKNYPDIYANIRQVQEMRRTNRPIDYVFKPSSFEFKQSLTPNRLVKTNFRSSFKDPITGATRTFDIKRSPLRTLGANQPVVFPGKILDSPVSKDNYKPPSFGKTIQRYTSFDPVLHKSVDYSHLGFKKVHTLIT